MYVCEYFHFQFHYSKVMPLHVRYSKVPILFQCYIHNKMFRIKIAIKNKIEVKNIHKTNQVCIMRA